MKFSHHYRWILTLLISAVIGACGGSSDDSGLADTRAYKGDSPYISVIKSCATVEESKNACDLGTLPLIGMEYNDPGIPQIMDRVIVSHDWMGERFEELLYELPEGFLPLFKGVTAIVIDDDIRPAYYTTVTGAIYLDPAFLWLSVEEKRTINPKEDYRAGFDDPLAFRQLNRYLVDGQSAYRHLSLTDNSTRELNDILLLVARLLLHELAHANDFVPPDSIMNLPTNMTLTQAINAISDNWVSTRLDEASPITSDTMLSLAGVMYKGNSPSLEDLEIEAAEVGDAFAPDGASDDYGYTNVYEDLAMLFEVSMMKYFFNADYELAVTSVPDDANACADYQIGWGERNRLGHESVRSRAEFTANLLLPNIEFDDFFETLEPSTEISGDWCLGNIEQLNQKPGGHQVDTIDLLRPYL
ncbi:MAG: hypothetical protein K6L80_08470 [Agarilytica sp.]